MARLESIIISGIRSYGTEESTRKEVKFIAPVTLFYGQNGCGKTTIIECIRHALTGEFPTGCKTGELFVSDPNLNHHQCINGFIELKFRDMHYNLATISRTLIIGNETTTTTTYEYVDPYLNQQVVQSGVSSAVSKQIVKSLFDVSEAVLNSIIFCQQEESFWPLSEDENLKKKLDLLFYNNMYDHEVDKLEKEITKHTDKLEVLNTKLVILEEIKNKMKLNGGNFNEKSDTLFVVNNKRREDLVKSLELLKTRYQYLTTLEQNIAKWHNLRLSQENELKANQKIEISYKELSKFEFFGSDEDLKHEIANIGKRYQEKKEEVGAIDKNLSDIKNCLKEITSEFQNKMYELARVEVDMENNKNKLKEWNENMHNLLREYNVKPTDFYDNFRVLLKQYHAAKNAFRTKEKEFALLENEFQKGVNSAYDKLVAVKIEDVLKRKELENAINSKRTTHGPVMDMETTNFLRECKRIGSNIVNSLNDTEINNTQINENSATKKAALDYLRSDLMLKKTGICKLKECEHLKIVFPDGVPDDHLKGAVQKILSKYSAALKELNDQLTNISIEVAISETTLSHFKSELYKMYMEFETAKISIKKLCGTLTFEQKCNDSTQSNKSLQKQKELLCSHRKMCKQFLSNKTYCPICKSNFSTKFEKSLKATIRNIPKQTNFLSRELDAGQNVLKELLELKPKTVKLESEMKMKEMHIKAIRDVLKEKKEAIKKITEEISEKQKMHEACLKVISRASLIDQYAIDITNAQATIKKIEQLNEENGTKLKNGLKRKSCNKEEQLSGSQQKYRKLMNGSKQIIDPQTEIQCRSEIEIIQMKLSYANSNVEEAKCNLKNLKEQHQHQLASLKSKLQNHKTLLEGVKKFSIEIKAQNLSAVRQKINTEILKIQNQLDDFETKRLTYRTLHDEKRDDLRDFDSRLISLSYIRKLRNRQKHDSELKESIQSISAQIHPHNNVTIKEEIIDLEEKIKDIETQLSIMNEKQQFWQTEIEDVLQDLQLDPDEECELMLTDIKWREERIARCKSKMIDLPNACFEAHGKQLDAINLALKNLWKTIYNHRDVDYIQIKSNYTEVSATKREYNYRVVQKKGDDTMQMRGKCSAGQKVLACLLIRIVLYEHFNKFGGIIALDEPTNNLDKANKESLSRAIAQLVVRSQAAQGNCQFLITTHDKDFLDALRKLGVLPKYFNVARSEGTGNTVITAENM